MTTYQRLTENMSLGWTGGTYATPISAAIYAARDISFSPEKSVVIPRDERIGAYYPGHPRVGGSWSELDFTTYLRGQHVASTPCPEGSLLRACGFYESGTTAYTYLLGNPHLAGTLPTSASMAAADPVDITCNIDALQYIALSMVGRVVVNFTAGQLPTAKFTMRGQKATSSYTETPSALTFTEGSLPVPVASEVMTIGVNTITPLYTGVVHSLEIDTGATIDSREDMNSSGGFAQPILTRYAPTAKLVIEADLLTGLDPDSNWQSGAKWYLSWLHNAGAATGQKITGAFVGAQSAPPAQSDMNGKLVYTVSLAQYAGAAMPSLAWS